VRITLAEEGGFASLPGLSAPVTIDVDRLDTGEAEELKRLVKAARFFDLPAKIGEPAKGAADYQHAILTVEDDGRRHTVRALLPIKDQALKDLFLAVQKQVKAARAASRKSPPGPAKDGGAPDC